MRVTTEFATVFLVFSMLVFAAPSQAQTQSLASGAFGGDARVMPAASVMEAFHADKILNMPVKKLLAILVGVGAGMYIAENFVPLTFGIPTNIIGVLLGALIGNWWYEEGMPPFG